MGTHRILLVEDNPGDVHLLELALRDHAIDYELDLYGTADAAIRAISNLGTDNTCLPDLILLDYNLPRGDGCDILSAASNNPVLEAIPKAVLTSSLATKHREEAMRLGARCFINKPADLDEFLAHVGSAIADLLQANKG